jgi:3-methyladenine DNA glycosylase AlkC
MQTITWSPNLRSIVKKIKVAGINFQSPVTEINSSLSASEEKFIKKSFTTAKNDQIQGTWF